MDTRKLIRDELLQAADVLERFIRSEDAISAIEAMASHMSNAIKAGGKIISCGNGGSHCDAMHFAEELTGRYRENRNALPALCISDASHLTCVGNDFGFEFIFSRYVEALGNKGDVLLAISTSGNSVNVLNAVKVAKEKGVIIATLTGKNGGELAKWADINITVPHREYADRIQEVHIKIIHILILLIEKQVA